ncbi:MAG: two-component sensor histidine kinase [Helicobacteraceae bacterium 4484_230]|nr:MAG: two-component sensor histidine kinase [Helicobacteraceae bacterium 4484_230]
MFSKRSIRSQFLIQLIVATAALIFIFSSFLYFFIKQSIYNEKHDELLQFAQHVIAYESLIESRQENVDSLLGLSMELVQKKKGYGGITMFEYVRDKRTYLSLLYPFDKEEGSYIKATKDITATTRLLKGVLRSIIIIDAIAFFVIILYAIGLSKMLLLPIMTLSQRLSNMNEHLMRPIKIDELPEEFEPLGLTLNRLIGRIQNFVKYQKELFIGAAHELKTPLAVIKLKNQVTMIKKRSPEEYIEAISITNKTIDDMNNIVANILNIGRQEGAQLQPPTREDVILLLKQKANDFQLLAESEGKILKIDFQPESFIATIQGTLLNQILQNFLQNALKFTPKDKQVTLRSRAIEDGLLIEVIDEGCGIDDTVDLFAPFKRLGNKSGVGLGLFLAKSAADAMGAELSIENRHDGHDGTVASLKLNTILHCPLP